VGEFLDEHRALRTNTKENMFKQTTSINGEYCYGGRISVLLFHVDPAHE
jgi:hypothetical protein